MDRRSFIKTLPLIPLAAKLATGDTERILTLDEFRLELLHKIGDHSIYDGRLIRRSMSRVFSIVDEVHHVFSFDTNDRNINLDRYYTESDDEIFWAVLNKHGVADIISKAIIDKVKKFDAFTICPGYIESVPSVNGKEVFKGRVRTYAKS